MKGRADYKFGKSAFIIFSVILLIWTSGVFLYSIRGFAEAAYSPNQYDFSSKMQIIGSFNTDFSTSKEERSHNVKLACDNFSWITIRKGERLSFNNIVGRRIEERGYKNAKIIVDGEYIDGVGGGVCQVSTTLYNAWIRAGLGSEYVKAHSLPSSYCELSQDATVSEYIDMVLLNDSSYDVLVNGYTKDGRIYFDVYGHPTEYKIKLRSEIVEVIPEPLPVVEWADSLEGEVQIDEEGEYLVSKQGKQGYRSRAIIEYYKDGKKVEERELRRDCYLPVQGAITRVKKTEQPLPDSPRLDWEFNIF